MRHRVRITDVSPRDGLQNEPGRVPTAEKARLISLLAAAGVDEIEATSFVSPKWVPQLGDAAELLRLLAKAISPADARPILTCLVPNERGLDDLLAANRTAADFGHPALGPRALVSKIAVFTAASETFTQRNTNASIAQTLERFTPVIARARAQGLLVRGYISCAIACPFEGPTDPAKVAGLTSRLLDLGCTEIDVADTIGVATPADIERLLAAVKPAMGNAAFDAEAFTLHLHDTFGRAVAAATTALAMGVRSFDAALAGLGGCPYASTPGKPAPGNLDTTALVDAIERFGLTTSIDHDALAQAATAARRIVADARASGANP